MKQYETNLNKAIFIKGFTSNDEDYSLWLFINDGDHAILYKDEELTPILIITSSSEVIYNNKSIGSFTQMFGNTIHYKLWENDWEDTGISVDHMEAYLEADIVVCKKFAQTLHQKIIGQTPLPLGGEGDLYPF